MLIILEKNGKQQRISVENHIAQRDRVEINVSPRPVEANARGIMRPATMTRETYHRTGRTVDGHPVFEYRQPLQWVESKAGRIYKVKLGHFVLSVHRHTGYSPDTWLASTGLFRRHELKSRDLDDAKAEAVALVRNILNKILIDMGDLPCR